jgi:hypothetical protein
MSRAAALATLGLLAFVGTAGTSATAAPTREPDLTVPRDMTVEAQTSAGSVVTFTATARGRDNASLPVDCRPPSGSRFGLGQTTVTCTAVDRPDEIATKRFRINVVDRTAPQLHVSADLKVRAPSRRGAVVTFRASASDLIDGAIAPTCSPNSGTRFPGRQDKGRLHSRRSRGQPRQRFIHRHGQARSRLATGSAVLAARG